MKRLYILRHAKALPLEMWQTDAQRELDDRGHADAEQLGKWLAEQAEPIGHIYCSDAARTRETYMGLAKHLTISTSFDEHLYLASTGELLHFLQELPDAQNSVMLIGHNPGLHHLATSLMDAKDLSNIPDLAVNLPTCGLVCLELPTQRWADIQPDSGKLAFYWTRHEVTQTD